MSNLTTEFKVGLFTILGIVSTVFAVFVISPDLFETQDQVRYFTVLQDAAGIMPKTHVKTNGVNIGKVVSVDLDANATKVVLEIRKEVKIPKGSKIEIRTVGFLGDKFIEIERSDRAEYIEPGGLIKRDEESTDLNEVITLIGQIAKDVKRVTGSLSNVLGGEEGEQAIGEIVENIRQLTEDAKIMLSDNRGDVRKIVRNFEEFSRSINEVLDEENKEKIDRVLAAFDESMIEVKGAAKNINSISDKIQKGEGTIGRLVNDDKTIEEIEGAIKDIREVLSPATKLQVEVDYHGEFRRDDTNQNYFNLNFRTRPDNYYVLGFTDLPEETVDTTEETITLDDDNSDNRTEKRVIKSIDEKKAIRFNLQFAKRWYWAQLRFGLFESTGGVASDLYFWDDRIRFSLEVFDFADEDSEIRKFAHVKTYVSALFYNHIYAIIGVDDPFRYDLDTGKVDKKINYYMGAGLRFTDQDLKALFGMATLASP